MALRTITAILHPRESSRFSFRSRYTAAMNVTVEEAVSLNERLRNGARSRAGVIHGAQHIQQPEFWGQ
jgi:hypothetical protein